MPIVSADPLAVYPGDDRLYYMDWTRVLATNDETIVSVDAVEIQDADGAALAGLDVDPLSLAANGTQFTNGQLGIVAVGKAALFRCSGGTSGVDYYAAVTVTTDAGNQITRVGLFQVRIR